MSEQNQGIGGQAGGQGMGPGMDTAGSAGMQQGQNASNMNPGQGQMGGSGQAGGSGGFGAAQGMHGAQFHPFAGPYYWPGYGQPVPPAPGYPPQFASPYPPGYAPDMASAAMGQQARGPNMAQVMQEIANGGNGLSSLTKLLDFDDKDFWKGALVGAAAVLLLTNDSVQRALFRGAVKGRDAVQDGVDGIKQGAEKVKQKVREAQEKGDE
ncbi:MAG: YtxH domain-containing protein [Rhodocyclaceae bacterium]